MDVSVSVSVLTCIQEIRKCYSRESNSIRFDGNIPAIDLADVGPDRHSNKLLHIHKNRIGFNIRLSHIDFICASLSIPCISIKIGTQTSELILSPITHTHTRTQYRSIDCVYRDHVRYSHTHAKCVGVYFIVVAASAVGGG